MKQSIAWHKECHKNSGNSLNRLRELANIAMDNYSRALQAHLFADRQIEEAVKQGKDGFDSDKFLIPKKKVAPENC